MIFANVLGLVENYVYIYAIRIPFRYDDEQGMKEMH